VNDLASTPRPVVLNEFLLASPAQRMTVPLWQITDHRGWSRARQSDGSCAQNLPGGPRDSGNVSLDASVRRLAGVEVLWGSGVEQGVQIDLYSWQGRRRDDAAAVNGLLVRPVWLPHPGGQGSVVGVDAPVLKVSPLLIPGRLSIDVVLPVEADQISTMNGSGSEKIANVPGRPRNGSPLAVGTTMMSGMKMVDLGCRTRLSMNTRYSSRVS